MAQVGQVFTRMGRRDYRPNIERKYTMQNLTLEQCADYLEAATIEHTRDEGHAIIHTGRNALGVRFILVNDMHGQTALTESL
jgi:hypothetical protein